MTRVLPWAVLLLAVGPASRAGDPPPATGRLHGVVLRDGKPAQARVEISLERTESEWLFRDEADPMFGRKPGLSELARRRAAPVRVLDTSENGRIDVQGLPMGTYVVVARSSSGDAAEDLTAILADGEHAQVRLDLRPRKESLRGRVVYADGHPWTGHVFVNDWGPPPFRFTDSAGAFFPVDVEGRFHATGLAAGQVVVCAFDDSGAQVAGEDPARPGAPQEYVLTVEAGTVEVGGRVLDASGSPLPGVAVVGGDVAFTDAATRFLATTGPDGRFRVRVPLGGMLAGLVTARAPGFSVGAQRFQGGESDLEFRLTRAARVRGRVTSAQDGRPVSGVLVTASTMTGAAARAGNPSERSTRTDAEGHFALEDLAAGTYRIRAHGGGWIPTARKDKGDAHAQVVLTPGGDAVVDLAVGPGARVVGTLLDADGAAVAGARVHAWPPWSRHTDEGGEPDGEWAVTDASGRFEIRSLVPGATYQVSAHPSGAPASTRKRVVAVAGEDRRVDFRLPPPRWVEVTVLDAETGEPIPSAEVHVSSFPPVEEESDEDDGLGFRVHVTSDEHFWTTDAQGRVRVGPAGAGSLSALALAEGYEGHNGMEEVATASATGDIAVTLRLTKAREVSGRVLLPDGSPAIGAEVSFEPLVHGSSWSTWHATVRADGSFRSEGLPSGRYRLQARRMGPTEYHGIAEADAGSESVVIRLQAGAGPDRILVRVLDPEGRPVAAAEGHFHSGHGGRSLRVEDGRAEVDLTDADAPEEREGWIEVNFARGADDALLPLARAWRTGVHAGDEVEIRLEPERTIEGHVLGPEGKGVPDVRVRAEPIDPPFSDWARHDEPWLWSIADAIRTDATGAYRVGHLGEGRHRVFVSPPATFASPDSLVAAAGASEVDVTLEPAREVTLTVQDPEGLPVPRALVVVVRDDAANPLAAANLFSELSVRSPAAYRTDAEGVTRVPGLNPEVKYVVGVRPPAGRGWADRVVRDWTPTDVTLRLTPGFVLTGVVNDAEDNPVAEAFVSCQGTDGVYRQVATSKDGRFRFEGLPEGALKLEARTFKESPGGSRRGLRLVQAGAEDVVIVLRPWER